MFRIIVTMKDVCDSTTLNFISRMVFGKDICVFCLLETWFLRVIYMTFRLLQDVVERVLF